MYAMCYGISKKFSDVIHLNTETLSKWLDRTPDTGGTRGERKTVIILDAREEDEYKVSHLEGALRVSPSAENNQILGILEEKLGSLKSRDENVNVVCYCSVGYRSSILARKINELKMTASLPQLNVYNLEGSIFKWANEGRPIVDTKNGATKFVHPYNAVFGALLNKDNRKYEPDG